MEKILYQNSTDCSDGLIIDFSVIELMKEELWRCWLSSISRKRNTIDFEYELKCFNEWYVERNSPENNNEI